MIEKQQFLFNYHHEFLKQQITRNSTNGPAMHCSPSAKTFYSKSVARLQRPVEYFGRNLTWRDEPICIVALSRGLTSARPGLLRHSRPLCTATQNHRRRLLKVQRICFCTGRKQQVTKRNCKAVRATDNAILQTSNVDTFSPENRFSPT